MPERKPASSRRFNFTKRSLEALQPSPDGKRLYYLDEAVDHLGVAVTPVGTKTFFIQRRINGRPKRMSLGRFPEVTVQQARKKAAALNMEIAAGLDPYERTRPARTGITFGRFFESEYLERHAKPHKKTWRQDADLFRLHLQPLADLRLGAVQRPDIQKLHVRLGNTAGKRTANMAVGLIRAAYSKAIEWEVFPGPNPAEKIRKFKEESRERYLLPEEVPRFFNALTEDAEARGTTLWRDFFLLALFTGARRANLISMAWSDVDLDVGTWTIPANQTKTGKVYRLPLSSTAVEILRHRRAIAAADDRWVFPGQGSRGHIVEPKAAWQRIRRASGLEDLRIHDLRRTLGSWQAAAGASLPIIGRSLGHTNPSATQVYARLDLDPVRDSVEKAGTALLEAANGTAPGKQRKGRA